MIKNEKTMIAKINCIILIEWIKIFLEIILLLFYKIFNKKGLIFIDDLEFYELFHHQFVLMEHKYHHVQKIHKLQNGDIQAFLNLI